MSHMRDPWGLVLAFMGAGNLANGAWMLANPPHWYENLPAGVPDFGPLNEHFVRDVGAVFTGIGLALLWAVVAPRWRPAACLAAAGFYVLHAIVHVIDTTRGLVGPEHWAIDFPGVYLPAVLLTIVAWIQVRRSA